MTVRANIGFMFEQVRHESGCARACRIPHWRRASVLSRRLVTSRAAQRAGAFWTECPNQRSRRLGQCGQGSQAPFDTAPRQEAGERRGTMKVRLALVSALTVVALSFGLVSTASATTAAPATGSITSSIPCTIGGVASTCQLTVTSFQVVNGTLTAVGTVTGGGVTAPFQVPVQATGTCQILDLTLGPLHLDLLGLVVDLNQVHLTITAQQGPGNLLGNLLCSVANLLNNGGNTGTALQHIATLLNQILARL